MGLDKDTKIQTSIKTWIIVISSVISATAFVVGNYYVISNQVEEAKNSPASIVEYKLKDKFIRSEIDSLNKDVEKLEEENEDLRNRVRDLEIKLTQYENNNY